MIEKFKDLEGKTIISAYKCAKEGYDDEGYLKLEFSDGTGCTIVAGYGRYTYESEGEYPTTIYIDNEIEGLRRQR
jgi:hypothetical protein